MVERVKATRSAQVLANVVAHDLQQWNLPR